MKDFIAKWITIIVLVLDVVIVCLVVPDGDSVVLPLIIVLLSEIFLGILIGMLSVIGRKPSENTVEQPVNRDALIRRASLGDNNAWSQLVESYKHKQTETDDWDY